MGDEVKLKAYAVEYGFLETVCLPESVQSGRMREVGRFAVTNELYGAVVGLVPSPLQWGPIEVLAAMARHEGGQFRDYPVTRVSLWDAIMFCNRLSCLLGLQPAYAGSHGPSEVEGANGWAIPDREEWEFAASAGNIVFNDAPRVTFNHASRVTRVGLGEPNPWGLYDMSEGIFEWTTTSWVQDDMPICVQKRGVMSPNKRNASLELNSPAYRLDNDVGFRVIRRY